VLAWKDSSIVHTAKYVHYFGWCDDSDYIAVSRSKHARPSVIDIHCGTFRFLASAAKEFRKPWVSGRHFVELESAIDNQILGAMHYRRIPRLVFHHYIYI
jgi:hypothetical protein